MRKLMRPVLFRFGVLAITLALPIMVQAQFTYSTNNGTITITGYTGPGGDVTIPDRVPDTANGLPVTAIGERAFFLGQSIITVTIPNSVTNIGHDAFAFCTSLTSITIPNSVTSIRDSAFNSCTGLTRLTIPGSVMSIGDLAFASLRLTDVTIPSTLTHIGASPFGRCPNLLAITVDPLNPFYSSVDGVLFDKSQTTLIQYPGGKAGSYIIPNSVTSIGNFAFSVCPKLTRITIPSSVTSIGDFAFEWCSGVTEITIPASVTNIGNDAFQHCGLSEVYFQGNAPSVGAYVFSADNNATVYYLPGTTGWGTTFADLPALLWTPQVQTSDASFGVRTNQFGFTINWASGITVVVEASTNVSSRNYSGLF